MKNKIITLICFLILSIPLTSLKEKESLELLFVSKVSYMPWKFNSSAPISSLEESINPIKKNKPTSSSNIPIKEILNLDGSLDLSTGFSGTINLANYNVKIDPEKGIIAEPETFYETTAALCNRTITGFSGGENGAIATLIGGSEVGTLRVNAVAINGTNVYVGGNFHDVADNVYADYIVKWDGNTWTAMPGINAAIFAITIMGGDVYVGGNFAGGVAKWTGTSWSALSGIPLGIRALANDGTNIYAGGGFVDAGGFLQADYIAMWNGFGWYPMGSNVAGTNGACGNVVYAIAVSGTNVYVGGAFFQMAGNLNSDYFAKWDGSSWSNVGTNAAGTYGAFNERVYSIAVSGNNVYVGGNFNNLADIPQADFVAKWNGTTWSALGSNVAGTNGALTNVVYSLATDGTNVYVGGLFTNVIGVATTDKVAKWNGTTWSGMGNSTDGTDGAFSNVINGQYKTIYVLAINGSEVFAGGDFTDAADNTHNDFITRWNGTVWTDLAPSNAFNNTVRAIAISGGNVYVVGSFTNCQSITQADYVAKWDGTTWSALGSNVAGTDGAISDGGLYSIAVSGSDVYVGGSFTNVRGNINAQNVAKWNGTSWSSLGSFPAINNIVFGITIMGTDVYVAGNFTNAASNPLADYIAKWNGTTWSPLGSNLAGTDGALISNATSIANDGTNVYVGGAFTNVAGNAMADYIAKWNGTAWSNMGSAGTNGAIPINSVVSAITVSGTDVYVGGNNFFTILGVAGTKSIAKWNGTAWSSIGGTPSITLLTGGINSIAVNGTDVYACGYFGEAGSAGAQSEYLAVCQAGVWKDVTCDPTGSRGGINYFPLALAVTSNGILYAGLYSQAYGLHGFYQRHFVKITPNAILSITLQSFTAAKVSDAENILNWELNCYNTTSKIYIEKSTDGINFTATDLIQNGCVIKQYNDRNVFDGKNYYRLKIEHDAGRVKYSSVKLVVNKSITTFSIYPNPSANIINIAGFNNIKQLQLYDVSGRKISEWKTPPSAINVNNIANGTYILKAQLKNGENVEQKVVIQK